MKDVRTISDASERTGAPKLQIRALIDSGRLKAFGGRDGDERSIDTNELRRILRNNQESKS